MSLQVSGQYTKNARVEAVQSLEISTHLYCGSHVGRQKSACQSIFPYNMTHNSLIYLAHNSVWTNKSRNTLYLLINHINIWGKLIIKFLHRHVFGDIILQTTNISALKLQDILHHILN